MLSVGVAFFLARRAVPWKPAFWLAVAGLFAPIAAAGHAMLAPRLVEERESPDGRGYAVFADVGMDSPRLFARRIGDGGLISRFELVGRWWLREEDFVDVVRPKSQADDMRHIYFGPHGLVAALDGASCRAAYDESRGRRLEFDELQRLDPRALLGDGDEGCPADVALVRPR